MKESTRLIHTGRAKGGKSKAVSPSLTKASTLLIDDAKDLYRSDLRTYGRHGSELHDALKLAFITLENGQSCTLTPSGLTACTFAIMACVSSGGHVLITDSVYGPVRHFATGWLRDFGVEAEFYDPRIGGGITSLIKDNTQAIILEAPGSLTLEIQDIPAIVAVAKESGVTTIIDNTWSGGVYLKPLDLGVDISVHAATKYPAGHSDVFLGAIISRTTNIGDKVEANARAIGNATSPEDVYATLRGLRTMPSRIKQQSENALQIAKWLAAQPYVQTVLHPALMSHPDHDLWARDFSGASSVFSVILTERKLDNVIAFLNALKLFGIGYSYGGFESLAIHCDPQIRRTAMPWPKPGPLVRFAVGLEDTEDLIADISQAAAKL